MCFLSAWRGPVWVRNPLVVAKADPRIRRYRAPLAADQFAFVSERSLTLINDPGPNSNLKLGCLGPST